MSDTESQPAAIFSGVILSPVPSAKPIVSRILNLVKTPAGVFTRFRILETMGLALGTGDNMTPENIAAGWDSVSDMEDARELFSGPEQTIKILEQADKS